jgi:hypothetical protein
MVIPKSQSYNDTFDKSDDTETENVGIENDSDFESTDEEDADDIDFEEQIWAIKRKIKKVREFELYLEKKVYEKFERVNTKLEEGDSSNLTLIEAIQKDVQGLEKTRIKDRNHDKATIA